MSRFHQRLRRYTLLLLVGFTLCFGINALQVWQLDRQAVAQFPPAKQLVQQGIQRYQAGQFNQAIALWQQVLSQISTANERAVVHSNLAQAYRQIGQLDQAIAQWEQAITIYRSWEDSDHLLAGLLAEQAQAYSDLGQHQRAITLSQSAIEIAHKNQADLAEAAAQGGLGSAYWALGNYESALTAHQASLKIARQLKNANYITTGLGNLGNVFTSRAERYRYQANVAQLEGDNREAARLTKLAEQDTTAALTAFEQSVRESQGLGVAEARALLNLNRLLQRLPSPQQDLIARNRARVLALLESQPDSRDKAYALINLATSLGLQNSSSPDRASVEQSSVVDLLEKALRVAQTIGDRRAESFALGSLGQMYESAGQYSKAMTLTRQAQFAAQQVNAADSLYRWQWQAGRIHKATGKIQPAIAAYEQAIATLQSIRGDIVAANKELQFDFRDAVEPVYRELITLLLESPPTSAQVPATTTDIVTQNLSQVLNISELLKLAELQNFFGDECVQVALNNAKSDVTSVDPTAAIIYSVILKDRTALILQAPNGLLTSYPVAMGTQAMQREIDQLRLLLEKRATDQYLPQAQKIYDLLIRPLESDLAAAKPSTLIFINDGVLRKVPMAALHDGRQFLIQKYPIATTPSLSLTTREPLNHENLQALALGLTVERPPFAALANVNNEVTDVQNILGGTKLLDQDFTLADLETQLQQKSYPVVHMATHGKFGVDAASTFLQAFDTRITIEQVDNALRSRKSKEPVELLTLSACQTAAGDNRSALGIAGVAVRAGAKSALASLWFISDEATVPLIREFYTQLRQPDINKAEALQRAQLKMIADRDYGHPAVWSPFILIGNWL